MSEPIQNPRLSKRMSELGLCSRREADEWIENGWVRVAMPDGLIVRDAKLDGRPVNLAMNPTDKGPGRADLLLSKTGRSVLTMKIVAPVTTVAGTVHAGLILTLVLYVWGSIVL